MVEKSPRDRFASMAEVAAALERLTGEQTLLPVPQTSTLGRLKSWSTGIFSGLVRPGSPRKPAGGTSTGSAVDENAPTLIDPP